MLLCLTSGKTKATGRNWWWCEYTSFVMIPVATGQKSGMPLIRGTFYLRDFLVSRMPNLHVNLHFLCTSDKVSPVEMSKPIVDELRMLEQEGMEAYDAYLQTTVLIISVLLFIICDNPRASELCNHLGSRALKYCHICMVSLFFT